LRGGGRITPSLCTVAHLFVSLLPLTALTLFDQTGRSTALGVHPKIESFIITNPSPPLRYCFMCLTLFVVTDRWTVGLWYLKVGGRLAIAPLGECKGRGDQTDKYKPTTRADQMGV